MDITNYAYKEAKSPIHSTLLKACFTVHVPVHTWGCVNWSNFVNFGLHYMYNIFNFHFFSITCNIKIVVNVSITIHLILIQELINKDSLFLIGVTGEFVVNADSLRLLCSIWSKPCTQKEWKWCTIFLFFIQYFW